jgi:hypothetical protein
MMATAQENARDHDFLASFPDKMECQAIYLNAILDRRTPLKEKVRIHIEGKDTNTPLVEVFAPSAIESELRHFKIGRGFHADLDYREWYGYLFIPQKKAFAYLEAPVEDRKLTINDYMRQRGLLVEFSMQHIVVGRHRSFDLISCTPIK